MKFGIKKVEGFNFDRMVRGFTDDNLRKNYCSLIRTDPPNRAQ